VLHSYSAGVVRRVARASAVVPFEQAADQVSAAGAIRIGGRLRGVLRRAGAWSQPGRYRAADHRGRVRVPGAAAGAAAPRPPGPAKARAQAAAEAGWSDDPGEPRKPEKRTAGPAGVAGIPPFPRTAQDILTALFGAPRGDGAAGRGAVTPAASAGQRPRARQCSLRRASPSRRSSATPSPRRTAATPGHARPWFALVDGNNAQIGAISSLAARYQVKVPILIDLIHVVQYLHKAAGTFFCTGDPEARAWVKDQAAKILTVIMLLIDSRQPDKATASE
jgi:hypothetical protein